MLPNASTPSFDALLGPSASIARVWSQIRRIAPYFRTVLLTGEPGSGLDTVAKALHSLSPMAARPLVTLPASECEREITAAALQRWARQTVFLPDLETLSPGAQHAVLHLLRRRRAHDIAVIAASHRELRPLVSAGSFSAGLAMQLGSLTLAVPPLRQRREDIPSLATHLLAAEADAAGVPAPTLDRDVYEALCKEQWPGNLDQLRAVLRKLLNQQEPTGLTGLVEQAATATAAAVPVPARLMKLDDVMYEHIRAVLLACNGNKLRAAEVLGISRSTLYRMLDAQSIATELPLAS